MKVSPQRNHEGGNEAGGSYDFSELGDTSFSPAPPVVKADEGSGESGSNSNNNSAANEGQSQQNQQEQNNIGSQQSNQPVSYKTPEEAFGEAYKGLQWSDLKAEIEAGKQNGELINTLRQENDRYKQSMTAYEAPFANEKIAGFNQFVKETKIDDFGVYQKVMSVSETSNPIDVLVTDFILNNPDYLGREDLIRKKIERENNVREITSETTPEEKDEIELGKIDLEQKSKAALTRIKEFQGKAKYEPVDLQAKAAAAEKATGERLEKFKPLVKGQLESLRKLGIPTVVKDEKGQQTTQTLVDFEFPQADVEALGEEIATNFAKAGIDIEKNQDLVRSIFLEKSIARNLHHIAAAIAEKVHGMTDEEYIKLYQNPSAASKGNEHRNTASTVARPFEELANEN